MFRVLFYVFNLKILLFNDGGCNFDLNFFWWLLKFILVFDVFWFLDVCFNLYGNVLFNSLYVFLYVDKIDKEK